MKDRNIFTGDYLTQKNAYNKI